MFSFVPLLLAAGDSGSLPPWLAKVWPIALVCLLGCASIYLLLPRPRPYPTLAGASLGTLTLVLAGILLVRAGSVTVEMVLFYLFSAIAIAAGTILVTQHNPARAALSFTLVILCTCGLFLLLAAPFLMAATIIIYAGAIVVTFLFVLMLAQQAGLSDADLRSREPLFAAIAGFLFLGAMLYVLDSAYSPREYEKKLANFGQVLDRIRQASEKSSPEEIQKAVGGEKPAQINELTQAARDLGLEKQPAEIEEIYTKWTFSEPKEGDEKKMKDLLAKLLTIGEEAQTQARLKLTQVGLPQLVHGDRPALMSNFSGPPPSTPPEELRRDPQTGIPQLPAENSAYLGKSLFTDYLLPVELGGFLLLVAVVGAIAISQRTGGQEKLS